MCVCVKMETKKKKKKKERKCIQINNIKNAHLNLFFKSNSISKSCLLCLNHIAFITRRFRMPPTTLALSSLRTHTYISLSSSNFSHSLNVEKKTRQTNTIYHPLYNQIYLFLFLALALSLSIYLFLVIDLYLLLSVVV